MNKILFTALGFIAGIFSAFAAENIQSTLPAVQKIDDAVSWGGFYTGLHAGVMMPDFRAVDQEFGWWVSQRFQTFGFKGNGVAYGVHAGHLWQYGQIVGGIELSGDLAGYQRRIRSPYFPATDSERASIKWRYSVTGRVGYSFGRALPYIKMGYSGAAVAFSANDSGTPTSMRMRQVMLSGYTIGAGIDYAFSQNWAVGLEYAASSLRGTKSGRTLIFPFPERFKFTLSDHTANLRVAYRF
jgi:outer membrane immunogenic protein